MTALVLAAAPVALGAIAPNPAPSKGVPLVILNSLDANPVEGKTFMARIGGPKMKGSDACHVLEQRKPRAFTVSPFGPGSGKVPILLTDRRRPSLTVLRWAADPNLTPGSQPQKLAVKGVHSRKFEGKTSFWQATVTMPRDESSYLVVRASWRDPHDCAAGPDKIVAGVALVP